MRYRNLRRGRWPGTSPSDTMAPRVGPTPSRVVLQFAIFNLQFTFFNRLLSPRLRLLLAFCLWTATTGRAAEERSISVTGSGEVKARPNRLEIELQASGMAELTDDAIVKYDDALRRVSAAFERLKIEQLVVEPGDLSFASTLAATNVRVARGMQAQTKAQTAITQSLKLTLGDVDQISQKDLVATVGKLIDTARDAGATIGSNPGGQNVVNQFGQVIVQNQAARPVVAFRVNEIEPLHNQAYQKAFDDASKRAGKLAKLAHARLGDVLSIDEMSQTSYGGSSGMLQQSLASVRLSEIPVRVSLRVRFELLKAQEEIQPAVLQP